MQGEAIIDRIINDANLKANEYLEKTNAQAEALKQSALQFAEAEIEKANVKANEQVKQIEDRFATLAKIESNKIVLNSKQEVLKDLITYALNFLLSQNKADKLKLVESLIVQVASKGETLLFNVKGLKEEDIKTLSVVKKLNLKVEENKDKNQIGLILSSEVCDKNLLFEDLIKNAYQNCQAEVNKILFD